MLRLIFALVIFSAMPAQSQLPEARMIHAEGRVEVFTNDPEVTIAEAARVAGVINRVIQNSPRLSWPLMIQVGLGKHGSQFKAAGPMVIGFVNYSEAGPNGESISLEAAKTDAIWIHELGHTLAFEYLMKRWPEIRASIERAAFSKTSQIDRGALEDLKKPEVRSILGFGPGKLGALALKVGGPIGVDSAETQKEYARVIGSVSLLQTAMLEGAMPYQELLGDALAAAHTGELDAVSKIFSGPSTDSEFRYRSLMPRNPLHKGFWSAKDVIHTLLAPVRSQVGKLLEGAGNLSAKNEILENVASAISFETERRWKDPVKAIEFKQLLDAINELPVQSGETNQKKFKPLNKMFASINRETRLAIARASGLANSCVPLITNR